MLWDKTNGSSLFLLLHEHMLEDSKFVQTHGSRRISFRIFWLIGATVLFAFAAVAVQLHSDHAGETALAHGPIMPIALCFYALSNFLAAYCIHVYATRLHIGWKILTYFGMIGGASDHAIEVWTLASGHQLAFGQFWLDLGIPWFPFVFFGITTMIGLYAMIYEYIRYESVAVHWKGIVLCLTCFVSFYFLFYEMAMMNVSSMVWHIGHIFFTHTLGSFIPIAIACGCLLTIRHREDVIPPS